jgi:hypothetical protein
MAGIDENDPRGRTDGTAGLKAWSLKVVKDASDSVGTERKEDVDIVW